MKELSYEAIETINLYTFLANNLEEWKKAVSLMYNTYGEQALYHCNAFMFLKEGDIRAWTVPAILPDGEIGIAVEHGCMTAGDPDSMCSSVDEIFKI